MRRPHEHAGAPGPRRSRTLLLWSGSLGGVGGRRRRCSRRPACPSEVESCFARRSHDEATCWDLWEIDLRSWTRGEVSSGEGRRGEVREARRCEVRCGEVGGGAASSVEARKGESGCGEGGGERAKRRDVMRGNPSRRRAQSQASRVEPRQAPKGKRTSRRFRRTWASSVFESESTSRI